MTQSRIYFPHNPEKTLQVLAWITKHLSKVTVAQLVAIIFFADRAHLVRHARPIVGGTYVATFQGPLSAEAFYELGDDPRIDCRNWVVTCERQKKDLLSKSDIKILKEMCRYYGQKSEEDLREIWKGTKAWTRNYKGVMQVLSYEDFFLDVLQDADDVLEIIYEDIQNRELLD